MSGWIMTATAGLLAGMTGSLGLGGGGVLLLYLTLFAGVPQLEAQGINLIFFLPIAALSLILYAKKRMIQWKAAIPMALLGLVGAVGGSLLAGALDAMLIRKIFAGGLLLLGLRELFHKREKEREEKKKP